MKHILRHLPFSDSPSTVEIAGETIPIHARQIIVWVSLSTEEILAKDAPGAMLSRPLGDGRLS